MPCGHVMHRTKTSTSDNTRMRIYNICSHCTAESTTFLHTQVSRIASSSSVRLPVIRKAILPSSVAHSTRGRPTLRRDLSVAGRNVPGQKVASRMTLSPLILATFPNNNNCRVCNMPDRSCWPVVARTLALDIRDTNEGLMPQMSRRQRF